jgi:hypothetical protein
MKKLTVILVILCIGIAGFGQINLEQTYSYSGTFTELAISGDKFFVMDVGLNQCRIYNTNHSIWKTINLSVPANNYLYDIQYISENLFTLDNALCLVYTYYSYDAVNLYYTYTTKIVKENGTVLLTLPGCQYYYATTLLDGNVKFVTYSYDYSVSPYTVATGVYNIPGNLVLSTTENGEIESSAKLSAFPNPASDRLTLRYDLPDGIVDATLTIIDIQGRLIHSYPVQNNSNRMDIQVSQIPDGIYFYTIQSGNYRSNPAKIIIN